MVTKLIKTKLFIPLPKLKLVSRHRLLEQINQSINCKLTLISAPAGFGKTTLLSEWISLNPDKSRISWLSLDKGDNDPVMFWAYVVTALQSIEPDFGGEILEALLGPQVPTIQPLLSDLINEIAEKSQKIYLVLDDYHLITSTQVNEGMQSLIDNQPRNLHVILSTRADPPWSLAQLRVRAEIGELRAEDLRFNFQEVVEFLNNRMGLALSVEDINELDQRTEGWIAGLQLAAISMVGQNKKEFISNFSSSHKYILDFLVEEVLDRQRTEIRAFLLSTSILERMSPELCDAVTDKDNSKTILIELEKSNLFLIPLDDERRWYRYHHLFAELLFNQLNNTYPEQIPLLHQKASRWYEQHGYIEETVNHAFLAQDIENVARVIEKYAREMLHQSKYNLLSNWIEALPDHLVLRSPWLCVYQSWTRHWAGKRAGGEDILLHAEQLLAGSLHRDGSIGVQGLDHTDWRYLPGCIAAIRAHYAITNENIPLAIKQARLALEYLPEEDYFTRSTAGIALGAAYWGIGDVHQAERAFEICASDAVSGGFQYRASSAYVYMGMQQVKQGRLFAAEATYQKALTLAGGPGGRIFPIGGYPFAKLAELSCEWDKLEQAEIYAKDGLDLCIQLGHVDLLAEAYVALARVQLAIGDYKGVKYTLQLADRLSQETKLDPWILAWLDECRIRLWLSTNRLSEAIHWVTSCGLSPNDQFNFHHELEHINLARVFVARGTLYQENRYLDDGIDLLARLLLAADSAGWIHSSIKIKVLLSCALYSRGHLESALEELDSALSRAEPGGYIRTFIDEGLVIGDMLSQFVVRGNRLNYVVYLLDQIRHTQNDNQPATLVESLSEREIQVLRLLSTHLTVPEIADQLYLSVHTVRSHVKSIYGKLDVHNRISAVQRAKELGLI